jgi:hypothetical protein
LQRSHGASFGNGQPDAYHWSDLAAWYGNGLSGFSDRHSPWLDRNRISRCQSRFYRLNWHDLNAEQRLDMFDRRGRAIGNVRIDCNL